MKNSYRNCKFTACCMVAVLCATSIGLASYARRGGGGGGGGYHGGGSGGYHGGGGGERQAVMQNRREQRQDMEQRGERNEEPRWNRGEESGRGREGSGRGGEGFGRGGEGFGREGEGGWGRGNESSFDARPEHNGVQNFNWPSEKLSTENFSGRPGYFNSPIGSNGVPRTGTMPRMPGQGASGTAANGAGSYGHNYPSATGNSGSSSGTQANGTGSYWHNNQSATGNPGSSSGTQANGTGSYWHNNQSATGNSGSSSGTQANGTGSYWHNSQSGTGTNSGASSGTTASAATGSGHNSLSQSPGNQGESSPANSQWDEANGSSSENGNDSYGSRSASDGFYIDGKPMNNSSFQSATSSGSLPNNGWNNFSDDHPRRAEVLSRDNGLNKELQSEKGDLGGHYNQLEREQQGIDRQEQADARMNGGYITPGEQSQLNREENELQNQINHDFTGNPGGIQPGGPIQPSGSMPSGPVAGFGGGAGNNPRWNDFREDHPRRSEVLSRDNGLNREIQSDKGDLGGHYSQLEREQQGIDRQEQADARMNGGYITPGEQRQLNQEENGLQNQINRDLSGNPVGIQPGGPMHPGGSLSPTPYGPGAGFGGGSGLQSASNPISGNHFRWNDFREDHPRRAEVLSRDNGLNKELQSDKGDLGGHYSQLERQARGIDRQEQTDARFNGGHITQGEQHQLNREENSLQRQINHDDKAGKAPVTSQSGKGGGGTGSTASTGGSTAKNPTMPSGTTTASSRH